MAFCASGAWTLVQCLEALGQLGVPRIGAADKLMADGPKRLLGRNPVYPALIRKFFVSGKIEANKQLDLARGLGTGVGFHLVAFLCGRLRGFLGSLGSL